MQNSTHYRLNSIIVFVDALSNESIIFTQVIVIDRKLIHDREVQYFKNTLDIYRQSIFYRHYNNVIAQLNNVDSKIAIYTRYIKDNVVVKVELKSRNATNRKKKTLKFYLYEYLVIRTYSENATKILTKKLRSTKTS